MKPAPPVNSMDWGEKGGEAETEDGEVIEGGFRGIEKQRRRRTGLGSKGNRKYKVTYQLGRSEKKVMRRRSRCM